MKTLWNPTTERDTRERVARLGPDSSRRWGRMSAGEMICHLADAFRISLGELEAAPKPGPFHFPPIRWLVIHVMPWPKGKIPTEPAFQTSKPAGWAADVRAWNEAFDRFLAHGRKPDATWPEHAAFGRMPTSEWGCLCWRHSDHHLRQFGV